MEKEHKHITDYKVYGLVLVVLLFLTFVTVHVTHFDLKAWNVLLALIIASIKVTIVLTWFMHLKFDHFLFRLMVVSVLILFIIFIFFTFMDYIYRPY